MRKLTMTMAALGVLGTLALAIPARADDDDFDDRWRRHAWMEHQWRENEWRERAWPPYGPPVIYMPPGYLVQPGYDMPPQAVYVPPGASIDVSFR